ncbi:hypothetical protein QQ045_023164 [Rhodiola kirilowii]
MILSKDYSLALRTVNKFFRVVQIHYKYQYGSSYYILKIKLFANKMVMKKSTIVAVVFLIVSLAWQYSECSIVTLEIFNWITDRQNVFITCNCSNKAKKKIVIGEVQVEYHGAPYEYKCATKLFGTLCKCVVEWGEHVRTFEAYRSQRDHKICGSKCSWYLDRNAALLCNNSLSIERPEIMRVDPWI